MRRRRGWIITIAIVLLLLAIPIAGMTAAFGTAGQFHKLGAWSPDGAAKDTFWDSPVVDFSRHLRDGGSLPRQSAK